MTDNNIYRWAGMLLSDAGKLVDAKRPSEKSCDPVARTSVG